MSKDTILADFSLFSLGGEGIGGWLTTDTHDDVFVSLANVHDAPISHPQLNQLLGLGHQAPVSTAFFDYYWLQAPPSHPYPVAKLPGFDEAWVNGNQLIRSLEHFKWGLYRLFTDGLLYFGNVRSAFRTLRTLDSYGLNAFFQQRRFDSASIRRRGEPLPLQTIPHDERYLVSEMACKSFGDSEESEGEMRQVLVDLYDAHVRNGGDSPTFRQLLSGDFPDTYSDRRNEFQFAMDDALEDKISSPQEFDAKFGAEADKFFRARKMALHNTRHYLSMANELDVYVATSMGSRENFRDMARFCDDVFAHEDLEQFFLRYFDPTLSAALGHEDKGLIECLMVKCAKVLVYYAGSEASYGKDVEAAMALSLGKPVIFHCHDSKRKRLYQEIHPLSRLIDFETGVAVGAMVTETPSQVRKIIQRLLNNQMEYHLEEHPSRKGYLLLKEDLTGSVVRLQTNDRMLTEAFWNHYHNLSYETAPAAMGDK